MGCAPRDERERNPTPTPTPTEVSRDGRQIPASLATHARPVRRPIFPNRLSLRLPPPFGPILSLWLEGGAQPPHLTLRDASGLAPPDLGPRPVPPPHLSLSCKGSESRGHETVGRSRYVSRSRGPTSFPTPSYPGRKRALCKKTALRPASLSACKRRRRESRRPHRWSVPTKIPVL